MFTTCAVLGFVLFCGDQLDTANLISEEGISIENIGSQHWPVGKSVGYFWLLIDVGEGVPYSGMCHSGQAVL